MAQPGFGGGTALNYQIPRDENINRLYRQKAARQKKNAADDAAYQKWGKDIYANPDKVDWIDNEEAIRLGSRVAGELQALKESGDPNYMNRLPQVMMKFKQPMQQLNVRKAQFDKLRTQLADDAQAGRATPEQKQLLDALNSGDVEQLASVKDPYGNAVMQTDEKGRINVNATPIKAVDFQKEIIDRVGKNPMYQSQTQFLQEKIPGITDENLKAYLSAYKIPKTRKDATEIEKRMGLQPKSLLSTEDAIRDLSRDPVLFKEAEQHVRDEIDKDRENYFNKLDKEGKMNYIADKFFDKYQEYGGMKLSLSQAKPPRATQAEKDKQWNVEGNRVSDAKNTWNKIPMEKLNYVPAVAWDELFPGNKPKSKYYADVEFFSVTHNDVAMNTPKGGFTKKDGKTEVTGIPRFVGYNKKTGEGVIVMEVEGANQTTQQTDAAGNPVSISKKQKSTLEVVPYKGGNKAIIDAEFRNTAENVSQLLQGKKGGMVDSGGGSSSFKSSGGSKKSFTTLSLDDKKSLQKQSGARTRGEFEKWLNDNGYSY